jgi:protein-S-isoprenylcysteine O-methyltransferase Ste14
MTDLLAAVATALQQGLMAYLGAAAIALGLFIKARVEEGFLRQQLGEGRYDEYVRRVPMLVPFRRARILES